MKTFKVSFYDYWNPRTTQKTEVVEARNAADAYSIIYDKYFKTHGGTAIVITVKKLTC